MIQINDIIPLVNNSLKGHYFKDITFYDKYCELLKQNSEDQVERPAIWEGSGNYQFIQEDTKGLICYHRVLDSESEDDDEGGFGKNPLTSNIYSMRVVFFGNRSAIDRDCSDINELLAREFKTLLPRKMTLVDRNILKPGKVSIKPLELSEEEGIAWQPEMVLFAIDYEFKLTSTKNCDDLSCDSEVVAPCKPVTVTDSDGVTEVEVPSGGNFTCTPSGDCLDATVENSDQSYQNNVASGGTLILPNIDFTDSDGITSSVPSVQDIIATPCIVQSGIAYQRPQLTGQTTSYRTGDDGWNLANNVYDYTPPIYPVSYALLDVDAANPFTTLVNDNAFGGGNKNRFTDDAGGQTYSNNYVIDHLTGLGIYIDLIGTSTAWADNIDAAQLLTLVSFTDWRMANINEALTMSDFELAVGNFAPFNFDPTITVIQTSTTRSNASTSLTRLVRLAAAAVSGDLKTTAVASRGYLAVRNHYT